MKKALIIGAGNIGLGFLGHLLWKSGQFSVTFVETRPDRVATLNKEGAYTVVTVSNEGLREEIVGPVNAVAADDETAVTKAVVETDLVLTAVGKSNLASIATHLARGLGERLRRRPRAEMHLIVVACENVYDNTRELEALILAQLPEDRRNAVRDLISFPRCMVDRIVPTTPPEIARKYPLAVAVEDFFQFVIDGKDLKAPFPELEGVEISEDLPAKLEQKLFTLNMLHAIVSYWGHLAGYEFVHEAADDPRIADLARGALAEVRQTLVERHPTITSSDQTAYGAKIMERFRNRHLKDPIVRVAFQPIRKLGGDERLVKPALFTLASGRIPAHLATGIAAALRYRDDADPQSLELANAIRLYGVELTIKKVANLPPGHPLAQLLKADYLLSAL